MTLESMNWSILVFGGIVVLGSVFYSLRGHKNYNGPIVERAIIPLELCE